MSVNKYEISFFKNYVHQLKLSGRVKSMTEIAEKANIKGGQSRLSQVINGHAPFTNDFADSIYNVFPLPKPSNTLKEPKAKYKTEAEQVPTNYMRVPIIPIRAQAGFLSGYGDDAYWRELNTELWEVDKEYKGHYVVFEVSGDSMDDNTVNAIIDGDRILCRELQRHHWQTKLHYDKYNFVIVHKEMGIVIKRIIAHNVERGIVQCHSLNTYYDDFEVNLNDVIALYNVVDLKRNQRL